MVSKTFIEIEPGVDVVKDSIFKYRIVHRIKNKDGTTNWFNMLTGGSWGNLFFVLGLVLFAFVLVYSYKHDMAALVECCNSAIKNVT